MLGPWKVEDGEERRPSGVCQSETGWNVCTFPHTAWKGAASRPGGREIILANASLIAAAPELLEAAVIALLVIASIVPVETDDRHGEKVAALRKAEDLLLNAISKAQGKSE